MTDNKNVEVKKERSEQEKMQDFVAAYTKLCEEYGYGLVVNPAFKSRDDGTWSVILQTSVGKIAKN